MTDVNLGRVQGLTTSVTINGTTKEQVDGNIDIGNVLVESEGVYNTQEKIDRLTLFPYKSDQNGINVPIIAKAIKALYVKSYSPDKLYYLAVLRRLTSANTSQVAVYSRTKAEPVVSALEMDIRLSVGDPAIGRDIRYDDRYGRGSVIINWNELPENFDVGGMWDGYEIDDACFSLANPLSTGESSIGENLNAVPDPYFKNGDYIVTKGLYPKIYGLSAGAVSSVADGVLTVSSSQASRKSFQVMVTFDPGWVDIFKAEVGQKITVGAYVKFEPANRETATLEAWGAYYNNTLGLTTHQIQTTPASDESGTPETMPLDDYVWYQRTVTLRQGDNIVSLDSRLDIGLSWLRLTDPDATAANPTKILIKQPCVIFDSNTEITGFYDTYRADTYGQFEMTRCGYAEVHNDLNVMGKATVNELECGNITVTSENFSIENAQVVDSQLLSTERLKLNENYSFPTDGVYLGLNNGELVLSINGIEYAISMTQK